MIKTLIVDDEELSRERISSMLKDDPDFIITGESDNGIDALKKIKNLKPDLVFLDIQMPGLTGLEVIEKIEVPLPYIIFVTAYDEHAIKAFELNAADYLLKPFSRERFSKTLNKIKNNISSASLSDKFVKVLSIINTTEYLKKFVIKTSGTFSFIPVEDVYYIEAEGNYINLKTDKGFHLVRDTISATAAKLDPSIFQRIHRSIIINVSKIKQIQTLFNNEYVIILHDNTKLKTGRNYKEIIDKIILS